MYIINSLLVIGGLTEGIMCKEAFRSTPLYCLECLAYFTVDDQLLVQEFIISISLEDIDKLLYPLTTTCNFGLPFAMTIFYGPGQDPSANSCFLPPTNENLIGSISTDVNTLLKCFSLTIFLVVALGKNKQATFRDCSIYICQLNSR